jgi:hypothetical protein
MTPQGRPSGKRCLTHRATTDGSTVARHPHCARQRLEERPSLLQVGGLNTLDWT